MLKSHTQCLVLTWEEMPDRAVWTLQAVGADGIQEPSAAVLFPGAGSKSVPAGSLGGWSLLNFILQTTLLLLKVLSSTEPQTSQQRIKGVCILEACWAREVAGKAGAWQRSSRYVLFVALCALINGTFPSTYLSVWSIATFAHLCYQAAKLKTHSS